MSEQSDETVISKIKKSAASEIWVVVKKYQGKLFCDVREYFHPADNPEWLPTKKGVSIPVELLTEAVDAAEALAATTSVGDVRVLQRGKKARLRFAICEYQKHIYGELRTYYIEDSGSEDWKPGKGVTIPTAMLGQLAEALRLAEDHLEEVKR